VRSTSLEWLQYNDPTESDYVGLGPIEEEAPERPEAYDVLMQLRRFNLPWSQGGYEDQPCILYLELNAVCSAEEEHAILKQINQRNRERANGNKATQSTSN
jgi:hypothetical protein